METCLSQVEIGSLVRSFVNDDEAITVAVFSRISHEIADTRIIAATQAAASLFGYDTPNDLIGRFVSTLHLPEDIKITRIRSAMRARQVRPYEDTYTMRIVRRDGTIKPVVKHVQQLEYDGVEIWVSRHKETSKDQGPPIPRRKMKPEEVHSYWGSYSVAEADAILGSLQSIANSNSKKINVIPGKLDSFFGNNPTAQQNHMPHPFVAELSSRAGLLRYSFEFQGTDTIAIDLNGEPGIYLHECQQNHCRKQFTSRKGNPQRCTYCGSRIQRKSSKN